MENKKSSSLGARRWASILLVGLFGQIAWAIENNYINLWVYSQSHDASHINWMTVASSVVATLTTFFIGALSDRLGKRKIFIALGYSIWGVSVALFGVMSLTNMSAMMGGDILKGIVMVGVMNVIVDCVMTFFGSTSNDAAFNAFVTDQTNETNRPFVESILSIMPIVSLAAMLGVGMILGIPGTQGDVPNTEWASRVAQPWLIFFIIFGALTTLVGIISFFLLPKDTITPNRDENYFKHMVKGFFPKTIKANPLFYISLLAFMFFNIGVDSFMPYIMVYMQNLPFMGNNGMDFMLALGIIFGVAAALVVTIGALLNRIGKNRVLLPALGLMFLGALGLFFSGESFAWSVVSGIGLIGGYLVGTAALGAKIRDLTPENDVGAFQSTRMVFVVMLPMIIGSNVSLMAFQTETPTLPDASGSMQKQPDKWMFVVTMCACALTLIPIVWMLLKEHKKNQIENVR